MATWHQMRNRAPLYHATYWSVVDDPPNESTSIMCWYTEREATDYQARCDARHGPGHRYILPPTNLETRLRTSIRKYSEEEIQRLLDLSQKMKALS